MSTTARGEPGLAPVMPGWSGRGPWRPELDRVWTWLPHLLVAGLAVPFIVRQNSWTEWANALWLLDLQTAHVSAYGVPSFFTDAAGMYFYPQLLFYSGPNFALLAYPSVLLGTWPVFAAAAAAAFTAASAGVSWTARNLGVPSRLAVVPGLLFALTPYTVSNLYGRGDWAELLAAGFLAVALGAATSLLCGRARSEPGVVGVLALATAGIAATHNLTLLFGALFAPVLAVALLPVVPGSARLILRRCFLVIAGAILGLTLCAAFLIPEVWLSSRTVISSLSKVYIREAHGFDRVSVVFDPLLGQPASGVGTYIHTQTLVLPLAWCLAVAAAALIRRRLEKRAAITLSLLGLTVVGVTVLIADPSWWESAPKVLMAIQFPFRLITFLALLTVISVAVLLADPRVRRSRGALALLLVVTAWQAGLAVSLALSAQPTGAWVPPTPENVRTNVRPPSFASGQQIDYRLVTRHPLATPRVQAAVGPVGDDSPPVVRLSGSEPVGSLVATRVIATPLIQVTGDTADVGATKHGFVVLRVKRSPWRATVRSVCTSCIGAITAGAPIALVAGRVASLAGVLALAGLLAAAVVDRRRRVIQNPVPTDPS